MDNFSKLFEKMNEQETPEDIFLLKIAEEIAGMVSALKGDYWFHEDIRYCESDVLDWLKENRPDFYRKAHEQPETVEGSDVIVDALRALGIMKEWHDVTREELETPEDVESWRQARGRHDED